MEPGFYVVQVVSDGCRGYPHDEVAEVAVCRVDLPSRDYDCVYDEVLCMDPREMGKAKLDYLEGAAGILAGDLYAGVRVEDVYTDLRGILAGADATSFDVRNVFYGYLLNAPWDMTGAFSVMPAVSARMDRAYKSTAVGQENGLIPKAYAHYCPGDPAGVGEGRRALDLAQMTASLAIEMRGRGLY